MIWGNIQQDSEQTQIFQGYTLPESLPEYISEKISSLAILKFWEYALLWVMKRPFCGGCQRFGKEGTVSFLLREIAADAHFAETDDSEGFFLEFKLAMNHDPELWSQFLTSFRPVGTPPEYGWMQQAFTVVRRGIDAYSVFHPPPDDNTNEKE